LCLGAYHTLADLGQPPRPTSYPQVTNWLSTGSEVACG